MFIIKNVLLFFFFFISLFSQTKEKYHLEIIKTFSVKDEMFISSALSYGKRIAFDSEGAVLFFNEKGDILKRIKEKTIISKNGMFAGVTHAPISEVEWADADSFVLYDSLGAKIWACTRKKDGGRIFHSRPGKGLYPPHAKIVISPDGMVTSAIEGFYFLNPSPDNSITISFYGKNGAVLKNTELLHPYFLQSDWSTDGQQFIISCPGDDPLGMSKNDVLYSFSRNGDLKWKYIAEGLHLTTVQWQDNQTLIATSDRILHATNKGYLILDDKGNLIAHKAFDPPISCDFRLSPCENYVVGYDFLNVIVLSLLDGAILWQWKWETEDSNPVISDCYFSPASRIVSATGSSGEDKGTVFIYERDEGFLTKLEINNSVDRFGRSLEVYFQSENEIDILSTLKKVIYSAHLKGDGE